jgi:Sulfotransferase domain
VKDVANAATRWYGTVTADLRPLPDFMIIGTKRGGTTSMWNWLVAHPAVLPMFPALRGNKSTDYFFDGGSRGERWYRSHFHTMAYRRALERRRGHRVVSGEASPLYMYDPRICPLVRRIVPDVKVIIQLRDPVGRAFSHWQERVGQGVEPLSFEDALAAEPSRTAGELARMRQEPSYYSEAFDWYSYRDRGIYHRQVAQWADAFPPDQVLVVASEDFSRDEQGVMDAVADFLGIPRHRRAQYPRHNLSPRMSMPAHVEEELSAFYAPHNQRLYELLGRDLGWSPAGRH